MLELLFIEPSDRFAFLFSQSSNYILLKYQLPRNTLNVSEISFFAQNVFLFNPIFHLSRPINRLNNSKREEGEIYYQLAPFDPPYYRSLDKRIYGIV